MEITFKGTAEEMTKLLIQVIDDSDKKPESDTIDCTAPRKPKADTIEKVTHADGTHTWVKKAGDLVL